MRVHRARPGRSFLPVGQLGVALAAGQLVVVVDRDLVVAVVGQSLDEPEELRPGPLGAEERQQVESEFVLKVVLDRLAVLLDQRDEARVPPGGAADRPKWSTMSPTSPLSTLAGWCRTRSKT
ncbi:hypothetical protein CFP71_21425 [Amycolatopsis thailandensis]|uniref:Uncharacterized protein n=1 Tax=Amycolatopsis thailandensis TaxID=589330 RepID=A0A229S4Q1_9PSEU|nr:hypothetical protein [Amycolatopsis thailandensis]OXM53775.1 hypothetical protein CFP71_21425 [Amycolatopsis thailandensis]